MQQHQTNGLAVAGLTLAVVSVVLFLVPFISVPSWILGLIFSSVALQRANQGAPNRGLALAGLWTCLGAAILVIVGIGACAAALSSV